uniref:Uncharacterized protein n=1 Tax=Arundo donax TaxID=35708 RepID=A0A0A9DBQ5_ARUDO
MDLSVISTTERYNSEPSLDPYKVAQSPAKTANLVFFHSVVAGWIPPKPINKTEIGIQAGAARELQLRQISL